MKQEIKNQKINIEDYLKKHPAAAEYRFLFECCRAAFAGGAVRYPDNIRPKVFLEIVQHHKLIPQMFPILKSHCENVSEEVLQGLQQLLRFHNLHILKLTGELVRFSKLFSEHDIPWLSIKGPALAMQLYGDVAMRQSGDLDILVDKNDLEKAIEILVVAGYVPVIDETIFSSAQIKFMRNYYRDITLRHPTKNVSIELHWLLIADRQSALNRDISTLEKDIVSIGIHKIPTLPNILNSLYLCLHGNHHGWYRLFWLWDFTTIIINSTSQQIEKMIVEAQKTGMINALAQSVALSSAIYSIPIPDQLAKLSNPQKLTQLAIRFIFIQDMMSIENSPFRVLYKIKIFTPRFFVSHYCRRTITFLLRKWKRVP